MHCYPYYGIGGGDGFDGPRDWDADQFAPNSACIDTLRLALAMLVVIIIRITTSLIIRSNANSNT